MSEHALPPDPKLDHLLSQKKVGLKGANVRIDECAACGLAERLRRYNTALKVNLEQRKCGLTHGVSWLDGMQSHHENKCDALNTYVKNTILADGVAVTLRKEVESVAKASRTNQRPRTF